MFNKIAFIGAGSMAEAMIAGITSTAFLEKSQVFVTNKNSSERLDELSERFGVQCTYEQEQVLKGADLIILSMKPSDIKGAIGQIKQLVHEGQLIVSVAAGVSTETITKLFDREIPVVRAMPNTSASIGASATAIAGGTYATEDHMLQAKALFNTIGTTTVVNEADMHIVTGISGSGPAYFYYMVEAMEQAAVEAGLEPEVAGELITQTVIGAGEMLKSSGMPAAELRRNITSPNGTTHAGLETLARNEFAEIVKSCVINAKKRSMELGAESESAGAPEA